MTGKHYPRKTPKPVDPERWKPHDNESWIFISQSIDTYGLSPDEFRVLAHVARRAGKGDCNASQKTIADSCGINQRRVMRALQTLCVVEILTKTVTGRTNRYKLQESSKWKTPDKLQELRVQDKKSPQ
jgi:Helix-turn-helix domain